MNEIIHTIGIISTSILALFSLFQAYQRIVKWFNNLFSWKSVEAGVENLLAKMRYDNYYPEAIFPMGRGGSVLAGLMSNKFYADKNVPIFMIDRDIVHNDCTKAALVKCEIVDIINPPKSILLVSGINATGETLDAYKKWLSGKKCFDPKTDSCQQVEVKTATLVESSTAKTRTDYCYKIQSIDPQKLKMPWYKGGIIDWQPPKFRNR